MKSTGHIAALDGLRGLAAIIVVLFHLFETFSKGAATQVLNHGYLAVEFFFLLSGYVLCHAYDKRWDTMSFFGFMRRRVRRLHPMIIFGSIVGLSLLFLQKSTLFPILDGVPLWNILLAFLLGCLMIPLAPGLDIRGWTEMYPLNSPQWTMLYEYLANIVYALLLRKAGKRTLCLLAALAAIFLADLTLNLNILSVYGDRGDQAYTVIGGWTSAWSDVYIALVRLTFPFLAGMLLSRLQLGIHYGKGPIMAALLLVAARCCPRIFPSFPWVNGIYELLCVLVVLPLVLLLAKAHPVSESCSRLCVALGEFSFPLYLVHFPFVYVQISLCERYPGNGLLISAGCFILMLATAWLFTRINRRLS